MVGMKGRLGRLPPLKTTKITLFTVILCNTKDNIRDIRPLFRRLHCQSSVVKYTSSLFYNNGAVMRFDFQMKSPPLTLLAGSVPVGMWPNNLLKDNLSKVSSSNDKLSNRQFIETTINRTDYYRIDSPSNRLFIEFYQTKYGRFKRTHAMERSGTNFITGIRKSFQMNISITFNHLQLLLFKVTSCVQLFGGSYLQKDCIQMQLSWGCSF